METCGKMHWLVATVVFLLKKQNDGVKIRHTPRRMPMGIKKEIAGNCGKQRSFLEIGSCHIFRKNGLPLGERGNNQH